jgi:hypothetical protein
LASGNNAKMIELWSMWERKVITSYNVDYKEKILWMGSDFRRGKNNILLYRY